MYEASPSAGSPRQHGVRAVRPRRPQDVHSVEGGRGEGGAEAAAGTHPEEADEEAYRVMGPYTLNFDPDVRAVTEFMQSNIPAARLIAVASGVAAISPLLWSHHTPPEDVRVLSLEFDDDDDELTVVSAGHEPRAANG